MRRLAKWLGSDTVQHRADRIGIGFGYAMMLGYLGHVLVTGAEAVFAYATAVGMMGFLALTGIATEHDPVSCRRCAASFPLDDAEDIASRRRWSLASFHLWMSAMTFLLRGILTAWCKLRRKQTLEVSIPVSLAGLVVWAPVFTVAFLLPRPFGAMMQMGFLLWTVVVAGRHRQLQRWCPWCRGGGGGGDDDGEEVPDPDPAPGKTVHA